MRRADRPTTARAPRASRGRLASRRILCVVPPRSSLGWRRAYDADGRPSRCGAAFTRVAAHGHASTSTTIELHVRTRVCRPATYAGHAACGEEADRCLDR